MDRQEVINIFAQEMAKTQKKADKFYYKQNDKDMADNKSPRGLIFMLRNEGKLSTLGASTSRD